MSIPLLLHRLTSEPWAIEPGMLAVGQTLLTRKLAGESFSGLDIHAALGIPLRAEREAATQAQRQAAAEGGIAVIPVYGVIEQRMQSLGTSTEEIGAAFDAAVASKQVRAILFDIDSPGGVVSGVPELAAKIRRTQGGMSAKPTLAFANGLAVSAAYWLASQADEVMVLGSGWGVGSLGVFALHLDESAHLEQKGHKVTAVSAGKFKLEDVSWQPLGTSARAHRQSRVDEAYGWFVRDVAAGRNDTPANVRAGYGEGRVVGAKDAVAAKLADRVGTFEDAVERLAKRVGSRGRGARAEVLEQMLS